MSNFPTITSTEWKRHFANAPKVKNDVSRQIREAMAKLRAKK